MRRRFQALTLCVMLIAAATPMAIAEHQKHDIEAFDATGEFGDEVALTARVTEDENDENCPCPAREKQVDFLVDGEFVGTDLTDENGEADLLIELDREFQPGEHTITARWDADEHDVDVTDQATLTVEAIDAALDTSSTSAAFGDDVTLHATLTDQGGTSEADCPCPLEDQTVYFTIAGDFVASATTDTGGEAITQITLAQDLHPGEHDLRALWDQPYPADAPVTDGAVLTIEDETTELEAHDGYLEAHLTDDEDNALVGEPVNFTVLLPAGQEQLVCTAYTDGTGTARCLPWAGAGVYQDLATYRADYAGDEDYQASNDTASLV